MSYQPLQNVALSTCWCSHRHHDGYAMLEEIAGLGFQRVELSHGIKLNLVDGIQRALQDGVVEVGSMHNFCPLPNGIQYAAPNAYQPSAANNWELDLWLRYTLRTLEYAKKWGVQNIVLHSGSANFFWGSPERALERWIEQSKLEFTELSADPSFRKRCQRAIKRVHRGFRKIEQRILDQYKKVLVDAEALDLYLCLENREGLEEFPLDCEHCQFIEGFLDSNRIAYWHDVGHAQIKAAYGLLDPQSHLEALAPHLRGFHIHDVSVAGKDHQALGTGIVDFDHLSTFFRPQHQLVLELSPKLTRDEVKSSQDFLCRLLQSVPQLSTG